MPAARRDAFIDLDAYDRLCETAEEGSGSNTSTAVSFA